MIARWTGRVQDPRSVTTGYGLDLGKARDHLTRGLIGLALLEAPTKHTKPVCLIHSGGLRRLRPMEL